MIPVAPPLPAPKSEKVSPNFVVFPPGEKERLRSELEQQCQNVVYCDGELKNRVIYQLWRYLPCQLQEGPKCGLVALSMATAATKSFVSANELYKRAVDNNTTKQGEMFSVESTAKLANEVTNLKAIILKDGLQNQLYSTLHALSSGHLLLVPYDADFNHSPCLKNGHKAHWAVISGIVIFEAKENYTEELSEQDMSSCELPLRYYHENDEKSESVKIPKYNINIAIKQNKEILPAKTDKKATVGKIYFIAQQGKSKHLALWSLDDLCKSNNNLISLSPDKVASEFIMPDGGVEEGLKGKFLILRL